MKLNGYFRSPAAFRSRGDQWRGGGPAVKPLPPMPPMPMPGMAAGGIAAPAVRA